MPPLPNVPNVMKITLGYQLGSDGNAINRLHFAFSGGSPSGGDCNAIAGEAASAWGTWFASQVNADTSLVKVDVVDLTSDTAAVGSVGVSVGGSLGGAAIGAGTAFLFNGTIGRRYRGGKPRSYMPLGDASVLLSPQLWTTTFVGLANSAMTGFLGDMVGFTSGSTIVGAAVNVSYYQGGAMYPTSNPDREKFRSALRTGGPVVDDINSWNGDQKLASQRRRNLQRS